MGADADRYGAFDSGPKRYLSTLRLCCFSRIALQQAAESLFAADIAKSNRLDFGFRLFPLLQRRLLERLIIQALMRSILMIMFTKLRTEQRHVCFAEDDEVVKTFLLNRLDETLDVRDRVR
jgi:hypothetical protein